MRPIFKLLPLTFAAALALTACGGGSETTTGGSPAAALWVGSTADGAAFNALILPDNTFWALYGQPREGGGMRAFGALTGAGTVGTASGYAFNAADALGVLYDPTKGPSALSGAVGTNMAATFVPGVSIQGKIATPRNAALGYSGVIPPAGQYTYGDAPKLASVVGRWDGAALNQAAAFIEVAADGRFTGAVGTCTYSGQLSAHPSGVNVFTSQLTLGPAPCSVPGLVLGGVALNYKVASGKSELIIAGLNSARTTGTMFYAQR
jgi:hypothetical protein